MRVAKPKPVKVYRTSSLERAWAIAWQAKGYPQIHGLREHRFHPTRRWRFDWCVPGYMVAVELDGAVWSRGRHTRGAGFIEDKRKHNAAAALGWTVFYVAGDTMLMEVVALVRDLMDQGFAKHGEAV